MKLDNKCYEQRIKFYINIIKIADCKIRFLTREKNYYRNKYVDLLKRYNRENRKNRY